MKVFLGMKNACGLNYQRNYLYSKLVNKYELTKKPEEVDSNNYPQLTPEKNSRTYKNIRKSI